MGFAPGKPYDAQNSGVGPYILERDKPRDAVDSFLTTYDTVNKWRAVKEEEKNRKAHLLRAQLADLDLDAKGIRPNSSRYVQDMTERIKQAVADEYQKGNGTLTPEGYQRVKALTNGYQAIIDGDVSANTIMKSAMDSAEANPDKIDIREFTTAFRAAYDETDPMKAATLVGKLPFPRPKSLDQLLTEDQEKGKTSTTSGIGPSGLIQESTTFAKKVDPTTQEIVSDDDYWLAKIESPEYRDALMEEIEPILEQNKITLPDPSHPDYAELKLKKEDAENRVEAIKKFQTDYNTANPTKHLDFTDAWYLSKARNYGYSQVKSEGQDAYYKAAAKSWGVGEEEAKKMGDNFWNIAHVLNGSDDVYLTSVDDKTGSSVYRTNLFIGQQIGTDDAGLPNRILDIQRHEDDDGNVTFKYKTSVSKAAPENATTDGYVITQDPMKIVELLTGTERSTSSNINPGKVARTFYEWSKKTDAGKGFWNDEAKTIDYTKLREIVPVKKGKMLTVKEAAEKLKKVAGAKYSAKNKQGVVIYSNDGKKWFDANGKTIK